MHARVRGLATHPYRLVTIFRSFVALVVYAGLKAPYSEAIVVALSGFFLIGVYYPYPGIRYWELYGQMGSGYYRT